MLGNLQTAAAIVVSTAIVGAGCSSSTDDSLAASEATPISGPEATSDTPIETPPSPDAPEPIQDDCYPELYRIMEGQLGVGLAGRLWLGPNIGTHSQLAGQLLSVMRSVEAERREGGLADANDLLSEQTTELCAQREVREIVLADPPRIDLAGDTGSDQRVCGLAVHTALSLFVTSLVVRATDDYLTVIDDLVGTDSPQYIPLLGRAGTALHVRQTEGLSVGANFITTSANEMCADASVRQAVLGLSTQDEFNPPGDSADADCVAGGMGVLLEGDGWCPDIELFQGWLNAWGYSVDVDGYFGAGTEAAVRNFQRDVDLEVDGRVGPATWAMLEEASYWDY